MHESFLLKYENICLVSEVMSTFICAIEILVFVCVHIIYMTYYEILYSEFISIKKLTTSSLVM